MFTVLISKKKSLIPFPLIPKDMKILKPLLSLIFFTLVVNHCNANLIEQTCKKTPKYALCIHYLQADPKSSSANVEGLALIMVDVINVKANTALNKINQLLKGNPQPDLKQKLSLCYDEYRAIVVADVPKAISALKLGDPKFAQDSADDAVVEASSCENSFSGKSPLTDFNIATQDAAVILSAIVKLLL